MKLLLFIIVALILMFASEAKLFFHAKCRQHGGGKQWFTYCANNVRANEAASVLSVKSNGVFTAKQSGYYRVAGAAIQYSQVWGQGYVRIVVNGKPVFEARQDLEGWHTADYNQLLKLSKGDTFYVQFKIIGSKGLHSWHNNRHSDIYVAFEGGFVPLVSGGCSTLKMKSGSQKLCFDKTEINTAAEYVTSSTDGTFVVKKKGFYRINGFFNGKGISHMQLYIDGKFREQTHGGSNNIYQQTRITDVYEFKKGQKFYFKVSSRQGMRAWKAEGSPQRLQISYEGADRKIFKAYSPGHRGAGWQWYYMNNVMQNTLGDEYIQNKNHIVKILKAGVYKINSRVIQLCNGRCYTHSKLFKNNNEFDYNGYYRDNGWRDDTAWGIMKLKAGDTVGIQYYAPNRYAYHNGITYGHFELTYEEPFNMYNFDNGLKRHGSAYSSLSKLLLALKNKLNTELTAAEKKDTKNTRVRMAAVGRAKAVIADSEREQSNEDNNLDELRARVKSELDLLNRIDDLVKGKQ